MVTRKSLILLTAFSMIALSCNLLRPSTDQISTQTPAETPASSISTPTSSFPAEPIVAIPATDGELVYSSDRNGQWQIIHMRADGSNETSLTAPYGNFSYPAWSPDGKRLAMRIDYSDNPSDGCNSGIAVMDVQLQDGHLVGVQPTKITCTFSDSPDWSPDGSQVIYMSSVDFGWDFFRHDLNTSTADTIPNISPWSNDPRWSPDGSRILFSADVNNIGQADLFLVNLDGSNLTQLTNNDYFDGHPSWSPDGTRIAFSSSPGGNTDIYVINVDGSGLTRLTTDPDGDIDPAWSPDGSRIAFVTNRHSSNDGNYEIYLINADGTGEMRLTNNTYTDRWPDWRPVPDKGGETACQSSANVLADVSITAGTRFLLSTPFTRIWRLQNTGSCTWTPDKFRLRFVEGDLLGGPVSMFMPGAIQPGAIVDISVHHIAPSAPGVYYGTWQLWDPAGTPVPDLGGDPIALTASIEVLHSGQEILPAPLYYLSGEAAARQIWRMAVDGVVSQVTVEPVGVDEFDISRADGRIAYISNNQLILADALGTGRQVMVTAKPDDDLTGVAWSPDGTHLAYGLGGIHLIDFITGEDRIIIENIPSMYAGEFRRYYPISWSPDGSRIAVFIGYYEWMGLGILSANDGVLLSEFPHAHMLAWGSDSQTLFISKEHEIGMLAEAPGLMSITTSLNASPQELVMNTPVWWPYQAPDGRLFYFMSSPDEVTIAKSAQINLFASRPDGITDRQSLPPNPLWLASGEFPDALWTPSGDHVIIHLFHSTTRTSDVLYININDQTAVYLMQAGSAFRWGK